MLLHAFPLCQVSDWRGLMKTVCLTTKTSLRRWNATSEKVSLTRTHFTKQNWDLRGLPHNLLLIISPVFNTHVFFICYVWVIISHLLSPSVISSGLCSLSLSLQSFIFCFPSANSLLIPLRFHLSFSRTGRIQPLGNQWHWFLISLGVVLLSLAWDSHRTEINCFQSSRI